MFGSHKSCRATIGALTEDLARSAETNANLTTRVDQANALLQEAHGKAQRQDKQLADAQVAIKSLTHEVAKMRAALTQIAANVDGNDQRVLQVIADIAPSLVEASRLPWLETSIIGPNVASKLSALHKQMTSAEIDRNFLEVRMSSNISGGLDARVRYRGTFEKACVAMVRAVGAAAPAEDVQVLLMKPEIAKLWLLLQERRTSSLWRRSDR